MSFGGLVVLRARYGVLSEPSLVLDVTHALQWHCVRRGEAETSLHTEGSKATMWGFADPSPGRFGREKQLQVLYMYGSEPHLATVADSEALVLPEVGNPFCLASQCHDRHECVFRKLHRAAIGGSAGHTRSRFSYL